MRPGSEASRENVNFWGESLDRGHYQLAANEPASQKRLYVFSNPLINYRNAR